MTEWTVEWGIEVDANTPEEAARAALEIQRNPESIATVFDVKRFGKKRPKTYQVDLNELDQEKETKEEESKEEGKESALKALRNELIRSLAIAYNTKREAIHVSDNKIIGLPVFIYTDEAILVIREDMRYEFLRKNIQETLFECDPEFLANHTKAGNTDWMIDAMSAMSGFKNANYAIKALIIDMEEFIRDAMMDADGYMFTAISDDIRKQGLKEFQTGDFTEEVFENINGNTYYVYEIPLREE